MRRVRYSIAVSPARAAGGLSAVLISLGAIAFAPIVSHARRTQPAADTIALTEWNVPWGAATRPRDPAVGGDGRIWFVGQEGNYVARFDPLTAKFTRIEIDPGTNPHTINVDRDGNAWYTGNRNGMIGRIDAESGAITRFPMPDSAAKDPHTIAFDRNGDLWGGASLPYAMTVDDYDRLWFVETGSQPNRLVGFDPRTDKFFASTNLGPAAPNTVRHMVFDRNTRSIWFGSDRGTIGRAVVPKGTGRPIS